MCLAAVRGTAIILHLAKVLPRIAVVESVGGGVWCTTVRRCTADRLYVSQVLGHVYPGMVPADPPPCPHQGRDTTATGQHQPLLSQTTSEETLYYSYVWDNVLTFLGSRVS